MVLRVATACIKPLISEVHGASLSQIARQNRAFPSKFGGRQGQGMTSKRATGTGDMPGDTPGDMPGDMPGDATRENTGPPGKGPRARRCDQRDSGPGHRSHTSAARGVRAIDVQPRCPVFCPAGATGVAFGKAALGSRGYASEDRHLGGQSCEGTPPPDYQIRHETYMEAT